MLQCRASHVIMMKVLIFDEATSAMHAKAESEVYNAIMHACKADGKRCVLLITHRLAMLERCDIIHCMKQGEVVQSGTHAELMSEGGAFQEMINDAEQIVETDKFSL